MAQTAVSPPAISPTKTDPSFAARRNVPATNGHYPNGSATTSDANSERMQVINDEKEFRCGPCATIGMLRLAETDMSAARTSHNS